MSKYLTDRQNARLVRELSENAGGVALDGAELGKACEAFAGVVVLAGLLQNWQYGYLAVGWSAERQELTWEPTDAGRLMAMEPL